MSARILKVTITLLLIAAPVFAADTVWKIFDIKGKASVKTDKSAHSLSNDKNLLETVRKGSLVKVDGSGKVVIVSLKTRQAFEVGDNSEAVVEDDQVRALKGSVSVKKGFTLPKGNVGKMGGIVMRGTGNTRSCLKALSPINTAIIDMTPELVWENNCDGLKQVTITLLADEKVVHSAETGDNSFKIPSGVVQPGNRYMWLVDGGANFDMASGIFTVLTEADKKEVLDRMAAYAQEGGDDVAVIISYIYFLDGKGMHELTSQESGKIKQRFPGAEGLKELP